MWLIVGLGNPGIDYARTRHNVGFMVVDKMVDHMMLQRVKKPTYEIASGVLADDEVFFVKPLTFMNRSGTVIREFLRYKEIPYLHVVVIHDDLDMETGRLRIRKNTSSGGHRGVQSIIENLGTKDFVRIKIGIGKDPYVPVEAYVLQRFKPAEMEVINNVLFDCPTIIETIITEGVDRAMNRFN